MGSRIPLADRPQRTPSSKSEYWERCAGDFDLNQRRTAERHPTEQLISTSDLAHLLGLEASSSTVLDAGCGPGNRSAWLKTHASSVYGIDISRAMLSIALQRPMDGVFFVQADSAHLPFEDEYFAAVVCMYVIDFVSDPVAVVQELRRVLKHQGKLAITVFGPASPRRSKFYERFHQDGMPANGITPWELESILADVGLRKTAMRYSTLPFGLSKLLPDLADQARELVLQSFADVSTFVMTCD